MLSIKNNALLKQLYTWKIDLNKYISVFVSYKDFHNVKECKKLQAVLEEFLDIYLHLEDEKRKKFYFEGITRWSKTNRRYMFLLENLYLSYLIQKK